MNYSTIYYKNIPTPTPAPGLQYSLYLGPQNVIYVPIFFLGSQKGLYIVRVFAQTLFQQILSNRAFTQTLVHEPHRIVHSSLFQSFTPDEVNDNAHKSWLVKVIVSTLSAKLFDISGVSAFRSLCPTAGLWDLGNWQYDIGRQ